MRPTFALATLALTLAGCAGYEVLPEVRQAEWEAKNVPPEQYRAEIIAYLRTYLNDPGSVYDAMVSEPVLKPLGLGHRFMSCVRFGTRHGSGEGGLGKEHVAIFVGGKLDSFREAGKELCVGAAYMPFPELERISRAPSPVAR